MTPGLTTGRSREVPAWPEALYGLEPASSKEITKTSAPAVTSLMRIAVRSVCQSSRRAGVVSQR